MASLIILRKVPNLILMKILIPFAVGNDMDAGKVFIHADLKVAADEFLTVDWPEIESEIDTVRNEINDELEKREMENLLTQWNDDVNFIKGTLEKRHSGVKAHAINMLEGS